MHHCGALCDGVGLIAPASHSLQPLGGDASADEIADDGLSSLLGESGIVARCTSSVGVGGEADLYLGVVGEELVEGLQSWCALRE